MEDDTRQNAGDPPIFNSKGGRFQPPSIGECRGGRLVYVAIGGGNEAVDATIPGGKRLRRGKHTVRHVIHQVHLPKRLEGFLEARPVNQPIM
jgi:hypothetical protein